MAIFCYICKKEVELKNFGNGFVGVCCKTVLCNYSDKPQFDMKRDEQKDISMHLFHQERRSYQNINP